LIFQARPRAGVVAGRAAGTAPPRRMATRAAGRVYRYYYSYTAAGAPAAVRRQPMVECLEQLLKS